MNKPDEYIPQPIDTSHVVLSPELLELGETLAKNTHEIWSAGRIADGYRYGANRDATHHPCLVPYDSLPETEKLYDRRTSQEVLKVLIALGWTLLPPEN